MAAKKTTTKGSGWQGWKSPTTKAKVPTARAAPKPKANGKVRGGNAHERDLAWHAEAKAPAEPKRGTLLERGAEVEDFESLSEDEQRALRGNTLEHLSAWRRAQAETMRAKRAVHDAVPEELREELKEAKELEDEARGRWDAHAEALARNRKAIKVCCNLYLGADGMVRGYAIGASPTAEPILERPAKAEELRKGRQPLIDYDAGPVAKPEQTLAAGLAAEGLDSFGDDAA